MGQMALRSSFDQLPAVVGGHGDDLAHIIDRFLTVWFTSDKEREVTRYLAILLIAAHHWGTTIEAKIMLAHSAFDYLSWVNYVLSGKRSERQQRGDKNGMPEAIWHLKELLRTAKIPDAAPSLRRHEAEKRVRNMTHAALLRARGWRPAGLDRTRTPERKG